MEKERKGLTKRTRIILVAVIVVSAAVLAVSVFKILNINKGYSDAKQHYDNIEQLITGSVSNDNRNSGFNGQFDNKTESPAASEITDNTELTADEHADDGTCIPSAADITAGSNKSGLNLPVYNYSSSYSLNGLCFYPSWFKHASIAFNFQALKDLCDDAVGYIYQKGTLSYPVVQAEDNNKYLRNFIDGSYNVAGTLFLDYFFKGGLDSNYAIMYGHNMDDGSMFGTITSYKDEEYCREHPYFEIYVGDRKYAYYVYSFGQVAVDDQLFMFGADEEDLADNKEFLLEQLDYLKSLRKYDPLCPIKATENSKLLILSTCIDYPRDYNYRYVVALLRGEPLMEKENTD
ncbi:MAG: class B sortase [Parasporobacterium sp.]|nr:class B sortase [Parasporobacterium sp.]